MFISLQNSKNISKIDREELEKLSIDIDEIVDFNLRKSSVFKIEGRFPELQSLDLRDTDNLELVDIDAPKLNRIILKGSSLKIVRIESETLLDISFRSNINLIEVELKTPNLEHIEFDSEKLSPKIVEQLLAIQTIKGVNHNYKSNIPKVLKDFRVFEENFRNEHKDINCSCRMCK